MTAAPARPDRPAPRRLPSDPADRRPSRRWGSWCPRPGLTLAASAVLVGSLGAASVPLAPTAPGTPAAVASAPAATSNPVAPLAPAPGLAPSPVQATDLETWAADLVAPPSLAAGDRDAALHGWLDRLDAEPDHPLAEATLRLVAAALTDVADPAALRQRLAGLDPSRFEPGARGLAARLVGRARSAEPGACAEGQDHHPRQLGLARVLAPLGPLGHPEAFRHDPQLLADPGFDRAHPGLDGEVRWRPLRRAGERAAFDPDDALIGGDGWALMALSFDVPAGGPAWLEVDLGDGAGSSFTGDLGTTLSFGDSAFRGWLLGANRTPPGYALSVNGAAPVVVDPVSAPVGAVQRHPLVLREGRNDLLLRFEVQAGFAPALAVLGADGLPVPGLEERLTPAPVGQPVDVAPPGPWPFGSAAALEGELPGPATRALRGLLSALDRHPAEGLADLLAAAEVSDDPTLLGLVAGVVEAMAYLPESVSSPRARQLVERGRALAPDHLPLAIAWSQVLEGEDRDEEALALMEELGEVHPEQADSVLRERSLLLGLGMVAQAELALEEALRRAPRSPRVLQVAAAQARNGGLRDEQAALLLRELLAQGVSASRAEGLARQLADLQRLDEAERWWTEALSRDADRSRRRRRAGSLMRQERWAEADALLAELCVQWPEWAGPWSERADLALRRGDPTAELALRQRVLELRPGHVPTRQRLAELTGVDPVRDFVARHDVDGAALLAEYDESGRDESVVRLLDLGLVWLFEDGSSETWTHELIQVRDLAACEQEGSVRLPGEVVEVATITAEGQRFEPALVGGEYVMPNLRPGDFIETITITRTDPPADGVLRPGAWFFRSTSQPFVVSRYVVDLPDGLGLRLHQHAFDGRHEVRQHDGRVEHLFERLDNERVLVEPGTPDQRWFVPWVEFGMDTPVEPALARMTRPLTAMTRLTPELREAAFTQAAYAAAGGGGQDVTARQLYAFVDEHLSRTTARPMPAVLSLLSEEGNPTLLLAALLDAVGIERELVWSRAIPPGADPEPDPPFADPRRVQNRLLLIVRPDDGPEVWCDPSIKGLPYGVLDGTAPGAEALAVTSREPLSEPVGQLPGQGWRLDLDLAPDGSARVSGSLSLLGAAGFGARQQLSEMPALYHRPVVQQFATQLLPGLDLTEAAIEGLEDDDPEGVRFTFAGTMARAFDPDADGGGLTRPLPLVRSELSAQVAVEGQRRLPFLTTGLGLDLAEVRLTLPEGFSLPEPPEGFAGTLEGWSYALALEQEAPDRWLLTRRFERQPFTLPAERYGELVVFCAALDDAEQALLRLRGPR